MTSIKETSFYKDVLKELHYEFADIFIFKGFVVSEIKEGISFNWDDHANHIIEDVTTFLKTNGSDIVYISHRINSYSVMPQDWIRFFKNSYDLKGYYVVSDKKTSVLGFMVENLFFTNKIKRFKSIHEAINYHEKGVNEVT